MRGGSAGPVSASGAVVRAGQGGAGQGAVPTRRAIGEHGQRAGAVAEAQDNGRDIGGSLPWYGGCRPRWDIRRDIGFADVVGGQVDQGRPGELAALADHVRGDPRGGLHVGEPLRRGRRKGPAAGTHRPDAEIWWPSIPASPYAGQIWAIEIELTAKHADRTAQIIAELTAPAGYARVFYLTAPAARGVVTRCAGALPADASERVTVWDLPANAYAAEG